MDSPRLKRAFILPGYFWTRLVCQQGWPHSFVYSCLGTAQWPVLGRGMRCFSCLYPWTVLLGLCSKMRRGSFFSRASQATSWLCGPRPHLLTSLLPWERCPCFDQKLITCFARLFSNNWTPWSVLPCNCTSVRVSPRKEWQSAAVAEEEGEGNEGCFSSSLEWFKSLCGYILAGNLAFISQTTVWSA